MEVPGKEEKLTKIWQCGVKGARPKAQVTEWMGVGWEHGKRGGLMALWWLIVLGAAYGRQKMSLISLLRRKKDAQIVLDTLWKEKKPKWHSHNAASIHKSPKISVPLNKVGWGTWGSSSLCVGSWGGHARGSSAAQLRGGPSYQVF